MKNNKSMVTLIPYTGRLADWFMPVMLAAAMGSPFAAKAQLNYIGGGVDAGAISFGVTGYGAPTPGIPTYIANNFSGLNDILSSPGGTFLTANPVIANNILSIANNVPLFGFQIGGGNGNGAFGSGIIGINGPSVAFGISDVGAGGGSASYGIGSWDATFLTGPLGVNNFGAFLSIAGNLPALNSAGVASLQIHMSDTAGVFGGGGINLAPMVLANSLVGFNGLGVPIYSFVALGGSGAAMLADSFGNFRGLSIDNLGALPAGDTISAIATLTIYADPMSFSGYDPIDDTALISATGTTLPTSGITGVPEPTTTLLAAFGGLTLMLLKKFGRVRA
jgi:hypothetical protein